VAVDSPVHGGTEVVAVRVHARSPYQLVTAHERRARLLGEGCVVLRVAAADGPGPATSIDFATRLESPSMTSQASRPPSEMTADAAIASNVPANTPSRSNTNWSTCSNSPYDQSTAARNVRWRSTAAWRPP